MGMDEQGEVERGVEDVAQRGRVAINSTRRGWACPAPGSFACVCPFAQSQRKCRSFTPIKCIGVQDDEVCKWFCQMHRGPDDEVMPDHAQVK